MKPGTYICEGCETRIPSTAVERSTRHGHYRFIEVPRIFCDAEDCPTMGAEMHRDPPLGGMAESA